MKLLSLMLIQSYQVCSYTYNPEHCILLMCCFFLLCLACEMSVSRCSCSDLRVVKSSEKEGWLT